VQEVSRCWESWAHSEQTRCTPLPTLEREPAPRPNPCLPHPGHQSALDTHIQYLTQAHKRIGNQWSTIARMLPGRTNASVKNFFYAFARQNPGSASQELPSRSAGGSGQLPRADSLTGLEEGDGVDGQQADGSGLQTASMGEGDQQGAAAAPNQNSAGGPSGSGATSGAASRPPLRIKLGRGMGLALVSQGLLGLSSTATRQNPLVACPLPHSQLSDTHKIHRKPNSRAPTALTTPAQH